MSKQAIAVAVAAVVLFVGAVAGAMALTGENSDSGNSHTMPGGQTMTGQMHTMPGGETMTGTTHSP